MATHMNRPHQPYPPMYHTPQSNSPASVASPNGTDHRSVYSTQQMPQQMYGYPQPYPMSAQGQYQPQPQHMTNQGMMMAQAGQAGMAPQQQQQQQQHPNGAPLPSPRTKIQQAPIQQRNPSTSSMGGHNGQHMPNGISMGAGLVNGSMGGMGNGSMNPNAVNPNAAPGPIPATTPLVVRQDNNGVQWIAFEYSRDRVKMEYTIRCDVESVNIETLPQDFKTENCVYPRACCTKDQYRGNRLQYETECNAVGWALAELNPPLRGKRGLIQRAVDSWRNSNQDPRLRSRRVRRMAKLNTRKASQAYAAANTLTSASPVSGHPANMSKGMPGMPGQPSPALHHHHQAHDGSPTEDDMGNMLHHHHAGQSTFPGNNNFVGVHNAHMNGAGSRHNSSSHISPTAGAEEYPNSNGQHTHHHHTPANDMRPQHNYGAYPAPYENKGQASLAPSLHDVMDNGVKYDPVGTGSAPQAAALATPPLTSASLFGDIPEHKRRKFILVDDPHRGARVRVRVMLDQVEMDEIPDSYRKSNSVYPRSYYARQMQSPPSPSATTISTTIQVPLLDGSNVEVCTPAPTKGQKDKEIALNDLGYRMSWSQSRVFAGRTMFLQRALDAYRNKMRSSMVAAGQDVCTIAPHLETRVGKRKWLERNRRSKAV